MAKPTASTASSSSPPQHKKQHQTVKWGAVEEHPVEEVKNEVTAKATA
jgi:hypothetical protein